MKILVTEAQLDSMGSVQESKVLCEQEKLLLGGWWLEKSSLMTCSMIYCIDWLRRHPSSLTRKLGDEGFISVGMRNAADATTLLRPLKLEPPAAHCDGGQGAARRLWGTAPEAAVSQAKSDDVARLQNLALKQQQEPPPR